ncbi:MAG: outer membrane protein transport protein [Bradymonadaceae bacterium]|nr:outer membrane protein transport protein [Lujinxingiaceae bacterium]
MHKTLRSPRLAAGVFSLAVGLGALVSSPGEAHAGGFEVGENTTQAVARGGTGVVMKRDPSAMYFNPALLPRARGYQLLVNANLVNLDLDFQRDPLIYNRGNRTVQTDFEAVANQGGFFPAPFLTTSWDAGIENFALAAGVFGPSAYGSPCFGELTADGCQPNGGAARNMIVDSNMIVVYFSLGAGYQFNNVWGGELSVGLTLMAAHLRSSFISTFEADPNAVPPWEEDPQMDAVFRAEGLTGWAPTGILGLAYARDGFRLGASYRPPYHWEAKGKANIELPVSFQDLGAALSDDTLTFSTWHAGSLRLGWGYEGGVHPGKPERARLELEANLVWENWSLVENFHVAIAGHLELHEFVDEEGNPAIVGVADIYQAKNFQDTYSLRLGGGYAFLPWLSGHAGGFLETGAQPVAFTNVDFVSWERYGAGLGATLHLGSIDLDLAYMHIYSPSRRVSAGGVYNQIPLSECTGPNYDHAACNGGTPPGNPQNNGSWSSSAQIASIGMTWQY